MSAFSIPVKKGTMVDYLLVRPAVQNGHAALPESGKHPAEAGSPAAGERTGKQAALATKSMDALRQRVQQAADQPLVIRATLIYKAGQAKVAPLVSTIGVQLAELDEQWQEFVHTHIDPLLGSERSQQLNTMNMQMSPMEKDINRRLLLAAGNVGVAVVATNFFLPLAVVNVGMIVWLGLPMYRRGYRALVDEHRLTYPVVLAGAQLAIIVGGQFVPGSVAMLVISATEKVINRTEDHFRRNMVDALGQQPRTVWLLVDDVAVETPLATVRQGDIIVVGAGEMIAVDGVIVDGAALIDQHRLTGEAQPAEKTVGDLVLASTIVLSGKVHVQVQKTGQQTSAAQIATILQRVSRSRISFNSRVQNFVDNMTLPMLAMGGTALLTLGPTSAAAIMSVGAGSVARFGGPISMLNHLNAAAKQGLLVKDARSMDLLKKVDTFVFDKTGTLTLEQPHVSQVHVCVYGPQDDTDRQALNEELLLCLAAAAESRQSHPIARAITTAAQERGLAIPAIEDAHLEIGYGIKVRTAPATVEVVATDTGSPATATPPEEERLIHVGSRQFMEMEGIHIPAAIETVQEMAHAQGHSVVMVAVNGVVAGAIELQPTVRPEARQAIAMLREQGMQLYIISGDHAEPTRQLAQALGIEHYYAGVLPQEKAGLVEQLKAAGRKVCFVGDGINDAIAMAKADVSVSLRGASTLATDTAQIVLMNQDLQQLTFLLQLARDFDRSLEWLFRLTLVPVGAVVAATFLLHTGIYFSLLVWQLGVLGGIGIGFRPLWKYQSQLTASSRMIPVEQAAAVESLPVAQ